MDRSIYTLDAKENHQFHPTVVNCWNMMRSRTKYGIPKEYWTVSGCIPVDVMQEKRSKRHTNSLTHTSIFDTRACGTGEYV